MRAREVIDEAGPIYGEETTTSVTIVVTDIDDELPVFNRNTFTVPVPEDVGKKCNSIGILVVFTNETFQVLTLLCPVSHWKWLTKMSVKMLNFLFL